MGSELIYYVSDLLNEVLKGRMKFSKTLVHFADNSNVLEAKTIFLFCFGKNKTYVVERINTTLFFANRVCRTNSKDKFYFVKS